jgi:hypothetical protein
MRPMAPRPALIAAMFLMLAVVFIHAGEGCLPPRAYDMT